MVVNGVAKAPYAYSRQRPPIGISRSREYHRYSMYDIQRYPKMPYSGTEASPRWLESKQ
jgi:hypothetical protein